MEPCVYIFTSPSNKSYIGQTVDFIPRINKHISETNLGCNFPFHHALRKYGIEKFSVEKIPCEESELNLFERFVIALFKGIGKVYNCSDGGGGMRGYVPTQEQKDKISVALKGKPKPPGTGAKLSAILTGRKLSPEHREKTIAALIGRPCSEETRRKMSAAAMGNKSNTGRIPSLEHREKISIANKGRKFTDEHRANISKARKEMFQKRKEEKCEEKVINI